MAKKINPYRLVGTISKWIGYALLTIYFGGVLLVLQWAIILELGWWGLLLFPAMIVFCVVFFAIIYAIQSGCGAIARKWRDLKYKWDDNHR